MLLQAGTLILYLLMTEVTDTLGQTTTGRKLSTASVLTDKVNALQGTIDRNVTKLSEELLMSSLSQDTCIKGQPHRNGTKRFTLWGNTTALCDTTTDEGGWVIIQRRVNGDVDFYRGWDDYKNFFGNLNTSFWLGNNAIHRLTTEGYNELRIELIYDGKPHFALYSDFHVDSERMNYRLVVNEYSGTAGNSLSYHNNRNFSTFDRDNDKHDTNCAEKFQAGWWFYDCIHCNLNGVWGLTSNYFGISWEADYGWARSIQFSEMKLRRVKIMKS